MSTTRRERTEAQRREQTQRHERHHEAHRQREQEHSSSPFSLMRQGIDEMDRWFQRLTSGRESSSGTRPSWMSPASWMQAADRMGDWSPAIEAFQRGNEFVIRADVPGMTRTDLHVEAGDDSITISGERRQEQHEEREGAFWSERTYGSFSRTIPLPPGAISDSARATFTNGVLEIVLQAPSQEARRGRRIDIAGQV
jgi:HSP20 family protein